MLSARPLLPAWLRMLPLLPGVISTGIPQPPAPSAQSPEFGTEVITLVKLLEQAHFNRSAVRPSDYESLIEDYMLELDPSRLFLIEPDRSALVAKHSKTVYTDLARLGTTRAAMAIVEAYRSRVYARAHWIRRELEKEQDFSLDEYYSLGHRKWLADLAAADDLWRKRLKHELLNEIVEGKSDRDAKEIVGRRYADFVRHTELVDATEQAELFLTAVCRLYDSESAYYSPKTFAEFARPQGLATIGASFERFGTDMRARTVTAETSADGKLSPGDQVVAIRQEGSQVVDVFGMTVRQIESQLPGPSGTKVEFTVTRGDWADPSRRQHLTLTRTAPTLQPTRARLTLARGEPAVGVVTLPSLYGVLDTDESKGATSSTQDVAKALKEAVAARVAGVVLDLRGNGGGYLSEAMTLPSLFVGPRLVTYLRQHDGTLKKELANGNAVYDGPLVILVDRLTASGAEIVAGALQCYGRAIIVGAEATWGNGTVQQVVEMRQLSRTLAQRSSKTGAAKFTIQKFYLPNGTSTQLRGVRSDIPILSAHDLVWDREAGVRRPLPHDAVQPDHFEPAPIDPRLLQFLRKSSEQRQQSLAEFAREKAKIERLQANRSAGISLQLEKRRMQRRDDDQLWLPSAAASLEQADVSLREAIRVLAELVTHPPLSPRNRE